MARQPDGAGPRVGAFVRGFFLFLEERGIAAAVLHGWQGDFEGGLSDVDFVIDERGFGELVGLVNTWCQRQGWLLCQVLRHETTAAYCVCAAAADPLAVVALDACSDYQRNGLDYLTQTELLTDRIPLAWGGFRLSDQMELRYRFAKAAAKRKDGGDSAAEFANYSAANRRDCEEWLGQRWGIALSGWDARGLSDSIRVLRRSPGSAPLRFAGRWLVKLAARMFRPAGLVVVAGARPSAEVARLAEIFGHLYFRRVERAERWRMGQVVAIYRSTLVLVEQMPGWVRRVVPPGWALTLAPEWAPEECEKRVVRGLHERCAKREMLGSA